MLIDVLFNQQERLHSGEKHLYVGSQDQNWDSECFNSP